MPLSFCVVSVFVVSVFVDRWHFLYTLLFPSSLVCPVQSSGFYFLTPVDPRILYAMHTALYAVITKSVLVVQCRLLSDACANSIIRFEGEGVCFLVVVVALLTVSRSIKEAKDLGKFKLCYRDAAIPPV